MVIEVMLHVVFVVVGVHLYSIKLDMEKLSADVS